MIKIVNLNEVIKFLESAEERSLGTSWEKATLKASEKVFNWALKEMPTEVDFTHSVVRLPSDNNGLVYIGAGEQTCTCPAGQHNRPCWHRAAARMLRRLVELKAVERVMDFAAAQKAADELFAD